MPPRVAVIGCGQWATWMHLPVMRDLAARGAAVYAGVCDRDGTRAREYAAQLGGPAVFTDAGAMLDAVRPDAIIILVNPEYTADLVRPAITRRIPFLVEKPPAPSAAAHRDLMAAAGTLPHVVAYNRRFAPYIREARAWLAGAVPQMVTGVFARHRRQEADFTTTAVHGIDTVLFLAGAPLVSAVLEMVPSGCVHNFFLRGWTAAGTRVAIEVTPDTGSAVEHYAVRGTDRSAQVAFPQPPMIDLPGWVELHEGNAVIARKTPADLNLVADDLPALAGVRGEHEALPALLAGEPSAGTLATTLQTQVVREAFGAMVAQGERPREITF
ncbi:MAG: Gfo/Idh/MocA family oxidoreductase [Planctomycetota bacterium]